MLLELDQVCKTYPAATPEGRVSVLTDISLQFDEGERVAVVGPSGCGKSTLLNVIGGLDHPTGGAVRLDGEDLARLDERRLAGLRNTKLGFVFQEHHLLPQCTVLENVLIPMLVEHASAEQYTDRAKSLLDRVGLSHRLDHRPGLLSGGECQRAAVVRALINQPRLVLADEPTGSLDEDAAARMGDLLVQLNEEDGVSLITVTHSRALAQRMQTIYRLHQGRLTPEASGTGADA